MIKVFLVEDEPLLLNGLMTFINSLHMDFEISGCAYSGYEALQKIQENPPDVLITDVRMPLMTGLELIELATQKYPNLVTIIISGYADFEYARSSLRLNVCDYLLKPFLPEEVERSLSKAAATIENQKQRELENYFQYIFSNFPKPEKVPDKLNSMYCFQIAYSCTGPILTEDQSAFCSVVPNLSDQVARITKDLSKDLICWVIPGKYGNENVFILGCAVKPSAPFENSLPPLWERIFQLIPNNAMVIGCPIYDGSLIAEEIINLRALLRQHLIQGTTQTLYYDTGTKSLAEQMEAFLQKNYNHPISLNDLADRFHYSVGYLSNVFRNVYQESPLRYLNRIRIANAQHLLSGHPEILVKDISALVGFTDPLYFSRLFRKETGMSPLEYREHLS